MGESNYLECLEDREIVQSEESKALKEIYKVYQE